MKWEEVQAYARHILYTKYKDYNDELLGEAYLAFTKAHDTFDPLKASFLTHFKYTLLGHLKDYYKYSGNLIYIPVNRLEEVDYKYTSFDAPLRVDDDMTVADIIPAPVETSDDHLRTWIIDEMASMYPKSSKGIQRAIVALREHMTDDKQPPRALRTEISNLKAKLRERYVIYTMTN